MIYGKKKEAWHIKRGVVGKRGADCKEIWAPSEFP